LHLVALEDVREGQHECQEQPCHRIARALDCDPKAKQNADPREQKVQRDVSDDLPKVGTVGTDREHDRSLAGTGRIRRAQDHRYGSSGGRIGEGLAPVAQSVVRMPSDEENLVALAHARLSCAFGHEIHPVAGGLHDKQGIVARFVPQDVVEIGHLVGDGDRKQECEYCVAEDRALDGHWLAATSARDE